MAKKHPRKSPPEALVSALKGAVDAGIIVSKHASVMTHRPTKTRSRISPVFAAAREAVTGERPGKISQRLFDTAGHAAAKAMEDSARPIEYELMADGILGIPDHAIWMAARQAAGDLFYRLPAEKRERRGERLLKKPERPPSRPPGSAWGGTRIRGFGDTPTKPATIWERTRRRNFGRP